MLTYLHHILQLLEVESDLDDDLQPAVLRLVNLRRVSLGLERNSRASEMMGPSLLLIFTNGLAPVCVKHELDPVR